MTVRLTTEFSTAITEARSEGNYIFDELIKSNYEPRIVNAVKLSLKNEVKTFSDKI